MNDQTSSTILAAIIGAIVGAVIQSFLPPYSLRLLFSRNPNNRSLVGYIDSYWGPAEETHRFHEVIIISKQRGTMVWGKATRDDEPDKSWDVEGRYDGDYIQMLYFPSKESPNKDFLDYGCYFLKKNTTGIFCGFSTGFGPDEENGKDSLSTDYHEMIRRR